MAKNKVQLLSGTRIKNKQVCQHTWAMTTYNNMQHQLDQSGQFFCSIYSTLMETRSRVQINKSFHCAAAPYVSAKTAGSTIQAEGTQPVDVCNSRNDDWSVFESHYHHFPSSTLDGHVLPGRDSFLYCWGAGWLLVMWQCMTSHSGFFFFFF